MTNLPTHLLPTSCYVCGTPTRDGATRPDCSHDHTNAEAMRDAAEHDARTTFAYSTGATTVEGHYVDTVVGR